MPPNDLSFHLLDSLSTNGEPWRKTATIVNFILKRRSKTNHENFYRVVKDLKFEIVTNLIINVCTVATFKLPSTKVKSFSVLSC